jgi:hypothetical protein
VQRVGADDEARVLKKKLEKLSHRPFAGVWPTEAGRSGTNESKNSPSNTFYMFIISRVHSEPHDGHAGGCGHSQRDSGGRCLCVARWAAACTVARCAVHRADVVRARGVRVRACVPTERHARVALAVQLVQATPDGSGRAAPQQLAAIPSPVGGNMSYLRACMVLECHSTVSCGI